MLVCAFFKVLINSCGWNITWGCVQVQPAVAEILDSGEPSGQMIWMWVQNVGLAIFYSEKILWHLPFFLGRSHPGPVRICNNRWRKGKTKKVCKCFVFLLKSILQCNHYTNQACWRYSHLFASHVLLHHEVGNDHCGRPELQYEDYYENIYFNFKLGSRKALH